MSEEQNEADQLLAEMQQGGAAPVGRYGQEVSDRFAHQRALVASQATERRRRQVGALRYSHEDCIDRMIMTPGIEQNELAALYGVTTAWMSIVINSDAFRARMAERKAELIDPALMASLNERYGALAERSVNVLLEKLNQPIEKISDKLALEAAALGAKAVGLGEAKREAGPSAVDHLAALAHRLVDLNKPMPPTIEGETRMID